MLPMGSILQHWLFNFLPCSRLRPAHTCRICPWRCPSRPSSPGHWPDVNQINIQILLSKLDRKTCIFLLMASISKQWVRILGQGALLSEVLARQCCWRHEKDIFEGTETWKTPPTHPPTHSPVKQENAPWFRRLEGYSTLHMNHIINWHFSGQPARLHFIVHCTSHVVQPKSTKFNILSTYEGHILKFSFPADFSVHLEFFMEAGAGKQPLPHWHGIEQIPSGNLW